MKLTPKTETLRVKVLIEISTEHHHSLLKRANEASPVYFRLKNAVKTESDTILIAMPLKRKCFSRSPNIFALTPSPRSRQQSRNPSPPSK